MCEGVIRNSYNDSFSGRNQNGAWNGWLAKFLRKKAGEQNGQLR